MVSVKRYSVSFIIAELKVSISGRLFITEAS